MICTILCVIGLVPNNRAYYTVRVSKADAMQDFEIRTKSERDFKIVSDYVRYLERPTARGKNAINKGNQTDRIILTRNGKNSFQTGFLWDEILVDSYAIPSRFRKTFGFMVGSDVWQHIFPKGDFSRQVFIKFRDSSVSVSRSDALRLNWLHNIILNSVCKQRSKTSPSLVQIESVGSSPRYAVSLTTSPKVLLSKEWEQLFAPN